MTIGIIVKWRIAMRRESIWKIIGLLMVRREFVNLAIVVR